MFMCSGALLKLWVISAGPVPDLRLYLILYDLIYVFLNNYTPQTNFKLSEQYLINGAEITMKFTKIYTKNLQQAVNKETIKYLIKISSRFIMVINF